MGCSALYNPSSGVYHASFPQGKPKIRTNLVGRRLSPAASRASIFASLVQREVPPNGGGGIVTKSRHNPSGGYRRQLPLHRGAECYAQTRRAGARSRRTLRILTKPPPDGGGAAKRRRRERYRIEKTAHKYCCALSLPQSTSLTAPSSEGAKKSFHFYGGTYGSHKEESKAGRGDRRPGCR